ncbi:MAG: alpha-2-macroglobulin family protein [Candidatus Electronema sp. V4]|uniref:alpha-2-macroglobulin family protein n=1 Tax=Candidatus Electronema sp. V4 TaxID=3454756 RepID=UPI0040559704
MKAAVFSTVLLLLGLFSSLAAADEYTLQHLEQEAQKFAAGYARSGGGPSKPDEAAVLLQAAAIVTASGSQADCSSAIGLHKQAAWRVSHLPAGFWVSLAKAAGCADDWLAASQSGWMAYLAAGDSTAAQKEALALTGKALEKRTTDYYNWTPAAISVYELLAKLGDKDDAERLITAEKKKKDEALSAEKQRQAQELAQRRAAEKAAQEAKLAELRQKQLEEQMLKIQGSEADTDSSSPKLCLSFNEELPSPDAFHYGDYIQVEPIIAADFSVEEQKLCIGGAAYGTSYTVTVRSGMKVKERTLPEAASLTVETEHREPALWFNQSDYVLADRSNRGIGLNSVNVDKVRLQLFRIHERNILGSFVQDKFRKKLDKYELDSIEESEGERVWQGSTEITPEQDKVMTSAVVLPQEVLAIAPGLYVLVAERIKPEKPAGSEEEDEDYEGNWEGKASQWVVVSDIGLSTYQGSDGLTVAARSLDTALPIAGLEIGLYARNNSPLATLTTDEQGVVRFAPGLLEGVGGQAAFHLMSADSEHGFTFLQLEQAPFDLSDRGVSGRTAPGPLDAYVYTERGIYRPGETVHIAAIVRDRLARAAAAPPMTLQISGPDGKVLIERQLKPDENGGYTDTINLANSVRSGNWTAALYTDVDDDAVGQTSFQVKSFKPPRLEVRLEPKGELDEQNKADVAVQADYFYGSPGSELAVKAKMSLQHEPHPFADYAAFYFGKDKVEPGLAEIELNEIKTDANGHGLLPLILEGQQNATLQPLKAVVSVDVLDIDGRAVNATSSLPVRHLKEYFGLKPGFTDLRIPESSEAKFEVIALDAQGQPQEKGQAEWRLVREEIDYQWFRKDGDWAYERIVRDQEEQRGELAWDKAGPQPLAMPTGWGQYRLELLNKDKVLVTTLRFTAGEQLVGESETPDSVKVVLDRSGYKVGETAKLTVTAPYQGQASLVLANTAVNGVRNFALSGKEQTIDIPMEDGWGAGVYALVTVYRPGKDAKKGADRAVGLVWLPVDPADKRLEVAVNAPEQTRPRQVLQVPVAVKGAEAGSEIRLTLAAVDEGVLQLTNFVSPDPIAWFFAKPQLGLDLRDMYGQLIIPPESKPLVLRSGAGEDGLRGAPQSNVKVVSLFSGVVQAGPDGTVSVPLDIPDFNGRLRLMAVAWSKEKTGAASKAMRINDPVVVSPSLPRYLADGDRSSIQLLIENIDGPAGQYQAAWKSEGAVLIKDESSTASVELQPKKRQSLSFPVTASGIGSGKLHLSVTGPEGYSYKGEFALNVRGKYLPTLTRTYSKLDPGAAITLSKDSLSGLYPATAKVALSVSSMPNVDVAGLLGELDRYPHGCLEQLTSRAMPLLYANDLAARFEYPADSKLAGRVQGAIELILQKQLGEGSFGLWSDESSPEPWLSAYAMDFLGRAKAKGFDVPDYFYKKGLDWLTGEVKSGGGEGKHLEAIAYAHWVLAKAGQARHEDARYLFDTKFDSIGSPLAQAQLAGTLALLGDHERAMNGLKAALRAADTEAASWWSYGSRLRDLASVISIIGETGLKELDPAPAWQELTSQLSKRRYLSTQEQAALIMAALTLDKGQPLDLEVTGNTAAAPPQSKPEEKSPSLLGRFFSSLSSKPQEEKKPEPEKKSFFSLSRSGESLLTSPVTLRNKGQAAVWLVTTVQGAPISEPAPVQNGFTVRRTWYNTSGEPLTLDKVPQSALAVVKVEGEADAGLDAQSLLIDLLPAGFEIEKAIVRGTDVAASFSWLPELSNAEYTDARDDRFIAAFSTQSLPTMTGNSKLRPFRFAYLVRAVTPGSYALPPTEVEAMYRPEYRARNKAGVVTVVREP